MATESDVMARPSTGAPRPRLGGGYAGGGWYGATAGGTTDGGSGIGVGIPVEGVLTAAVTGQ